MAAIDEGHGDPQPVGELIVELRDGTKARVRPIVPADAEALRQGLAELSAQSRTNRFLAPVSKLTRAQLNALVEVDGVNHVAFGVLAPAHEANEKPVAIGRIIRYDDNPAVADLAITVADEWQRRGIGMLLGGLLAQHRPNGVTAIRTIIHAGNHAALALAERMGRVRRTPAGESSYEVLIEPFD